MGKHTPLPSDPDARAAEKRRRFKVYQKDWKRRRREEDRRRATAKHKARRELEEGARALGLDLCFDFKLSTNEHLRRSIDAVKGWAPCQ